MSNQRSWILKIIGAVSIATISTIAVIYISHKILRKFYLKHDPWKQIHATFNRNVYKKTFQSGVVRAYETNSYEANSPNEDNSSMCIYKNSFGELRFVCGIYDGHSTDACSKFCSEDLIAFIHRRLMMIEQYIMNNKDPNLIKKYRQSKSNLIKEALIHGFKDADELFICESILNYLKSLGSNFNRCISGSCCNVVLIEDNIIYTANVGDCRAVLGSIKDNKIICKELSTDHNTDNMNEVMRIKQEHSNEEYVIVNGRVKGILKPTRNIGDALLKEKIIEVFLQKESIGEPWNPPYVSSTPEITTHNITEDDKFIIIASDGFWDLVSSQQSVEIVVDYINKVNKGILRGIPVTTYLIERALSEIKVKFRDLKLSKEERVIELLSRIIELPLSDRRNIHDDITVSVIFLNKRKSSIHSSFKGITPNKPLIIDRINKLKSTLNPKEIFSSKESPESFRISEYIRNCWPKDLDKWSINSSCTIEELFKTYGIIKEK